MAQNTKEVKIGLDLDIARQQGKPQQKAAEPAGAVIKNSHLSYGMQEGAKASVIDSKSNQDLKVNPQSPTNPPIVFSLPQHQPQATYPSTKSVREKFQEFLYTLAW